MKIEKIKLTPEKARELLDTQISNQRPLSLARVKLYADEMKKGRWKTNGDVVRLAESGQLLDGQHRCHAVIMSGVTIDIVLVTRLDEDVFDTIDRGKLRTPADMLAIATGTTYGKEAASIITWTLCLERSISCGFVRRPTTDKCEYQEIEECFLQRRAAIEEAAQFSRLWCKKAKHMRPVALFSALRMVLRRSHSPMGFFEALAGGANLSEGDPVLILRNRLIASIAGGRNILQHEEIVAYTIACWGVYMRGIKIRQIPPINTDDEGRIRMPLVARSPRNLERGELEVEFSMPGQKRREA